MKRVRVTDILEKAICLLQTVDKVPTNVGLFYI